MLLLNSIFFDKLLSEAESSSRKRAHYNIHKDYSEPVQRLCIALKSGTYVRPHCHTDSDGWELIMTVKGDVVILIFDDCGYVKKRYALSPTTSNVGVELEPNTFHMVFPVNSDAVIFEVKEGPFIPKKTSDFATWAPEEDSDEVENFLDWAKEAKVGDKYGTSRH